METIRTRQMEREIDGLRGAMRALIAACDTIPFGQRPHYELNIARRLLNEGHLTTDAISVTPSCGCVFCDIRLPIIFVDGKPTHEVTDTKQKTIAIECAAKAQG